MATSSETVLQFGGGNFLRAFADLFIHEVNKTDHPVGRIVVVQSTNSQRAQFLNEQAGRYHVVTRGLVNGQEIDKTEEVTSITRGLVAQETWPDVLAVAQSPQLRLIISNVAEAGYTLEDADSAYPLHDSHNVPHAPASFPAKLLALLYARHQANLPGVTVLPCELLDHNAARLLTLLHEQAARWKMPPTPSTRSSMAIHRPSYKNW